MCILILLKCAVVIIFELFEVNHIRTIYHMFIALLILFIISTLVVDFIDEGRLVLDFSLLVYAFGNFPLVVSTWLCMFLSTFTIPYALLHQWARQYRSARFKGLSCLWAGTLFLIFQTVVLGFLPTYVVLRNNFPPASRFIIILEQVKRSTCFFVIFFTFLIYIKVFRFKAPV
uniref:Uncharacterized protein n=1 Tax=Erpetoichthys calabaricus TaxID=27687 RepID=A0A8C4TB42_ERPCA